MKGDKTIGSRESQEASNKCCNPEQEGNQRAS